MNLVKKLTLLPVFFLTVFFLGLMISPTKTHAAYNVYTKVFIDDNGDGIPQSSEKCFIKNYTVKLYSPSPNFTLLKTLTLYNRQSSTQPSVETSSCYNYDQDSNKVTVDAQAIPVSKIALTVPSGYKATKLSSLGFGGNYTSPISGSSTTVTVNSKIAFGIKKDEVYGPPAPASKPSITASGSFNSSKTVTISTTTSTGKIKYTTNTYDPASAIYGVNTSTGPSITFTVSSTTTVKARAYNGASYSDMVQATYTKTSTSTPPTTPYCSDEKDISCFKIGKVCDPTSSGGTCVNPPAVPTTNPCYTANNCPNGARCSNDKDCKSRICGTSPYGKYCFPKTNNDSDPDPGKTNCKKAPDVSIAQNSLSGKPGESKSADVKITNKNDDKCDKTEYTLSHNDLGSKWTATFDHQTVNLKPNEDTIIKVTVKPNKSVKNGAEKTVTVSARKGKANGAATVTYTVTGGGDNGGGNPDPGNPPPDNGGGGNTKLNVTIGIDGMGTTPRIAIGGNQNPIDGYSSRPLTFKLYNTSDNSPAATKDQSVAYNNSDKKFHATFSLPNTVTTGSYNIYALGLPYINARIPGSVTITKDATTPVNNNNFYMITGNINNKDQSENKIDLLDYNIMISCWIYATNSSTCDQDDNYISNSDLNGDGNVDQDDYTLLLKEMGNQGASLPDE